MNWLTAALFIVLGVALSEGSVFVRSKTKGMSEIQMTDLAIIHNEDGTLFGIYNAKELLNFSREQYDVTYDDFAHYLNYADDSSLKSLSSLPGFTPGGHWLSEYLPTSELFWRRWKNIKVKSCPLSMKGESSSGSWIEPRLLRV